MYEEIYELCQNTEKVMGMFSKELLELDPNLKTPRGEALRILLYLFERDDAVKTYLAG